MRTAFESKIRRALWRDTIIGSSLLAAALVLSVTDLASVQAQVCYTPEVIIGKGAAASLSVVVRMEGVELRKFNEQYEKRFNNTAPDVDLVLVFGDSEPEGKMLWLVLFKDGCLIAKPVPMSAETFNLLHEGQKI